MPKSPTLIGRAFCFSGLLHLPCAANAPLRYSGLMFDVLVYLYEHYWRPDACPESDLLARKLTAVGFEADEIREALAWLDGLNSLSVHEGVDQSEGSTRVYSAHELGHLGTEALGFLQFLESAGVLSTRLREVVLDRALVIPGGPISLEDLKIVVLMLFWSRGEEPDALILDELFVEPEDRLIH